MDPIVVVLEGMTREICGLGPPPWSPASHAENANAMWPKRAPYLRGTSFVQNAFCVVEDMRTASAEF